MQDLIDIGYGYDETDPFIDNSEAVSSLLRMHTHHFMHYSYVVTYMLNSFFNSQHEAQTFTVHQTIFQCVHLQCLKVLVVLFG